jgi:tRNA G18 (ribose-2'-O)-methylase SpoU
MHQVQNILSLDDPRIAAYANLRERNLRGEGWLITEGSLLAERLLQSRFPVESLFVTPENATRFAQLLQDRAPLYVAEPALMRQIVGFDFHRGVLGLGRRLPFPDVTALIEQITKREEKPSERLSFLRLIACPSTESTENLGLILRSAAAFGVQGVLLPSDGADPLSRRCLRQSMGSALAVPIARSDDLLQELSELRRATGLRLVAAVAADNASNGQDEVIPLNHFVWPERAVLVVGNEYQGLSSQWLQQCDYRVTIPLASGCDSLNVAVATGILLHHMSCASVTQNA